MLKNSKKSMVLTRFFMMKKREKSMISMEWKVSKDSHKEEEMVDLVISLICSFQVEEEVEKDKNNNLNQLQFNKK